MGTNFAFFKNFGSFQDLGKHMSNNCCGAENFRYVRSFSPGFGRSPNPGLSGDSKPRGSSVKPGSGRWPSAWAICWWLAGGQLSKAGGGESVLYWHLHLGRTWVFECQIILLWTVFVQLFKLAWLFSVDMAPCWRRPCHLHAWGVFSLPDHSRPLGLS